MKANMADVRIISFTTADPNRQVEFSAETKAGNSIAARVRDQGGGKRARSFSGFLANLHCDRNHEHSDDARQSVDNKISYARVAAGYK